MKTLAFYAVLPEGVMICHPFGRYEGGKWRKGPVIDTFPHHMKEQVVNKVNEINKIHSTSRLEP